MSTPVPGLVGFGEAGPRFASGLRETGGGGLFAFGIAADTPVARERIRRRAAESKVVPVDAGKALELLAMLQDTARATPAIFR